MNIDSPDSTDRMKTVYTYTAFTDEVFYYIYNIQTIKSIHTKYTLYTNRSYSECILFFIISQFCLAFAPLVILFDRAPCVVKKNSTGPHKFSLCSLTIRPSVNFFHFLQLSKLHINSRVSLILRK